MLDKFFKLSEHNTNVRTEVIAGITTFLTMAYIIFVNPNVLSSTGMNHGSVFVATCLAAAAGSFIMGLYANYPIAQAPGMGLNAFFTYTVVMGMHYSWHIALAAVFCSGVLFVLLSLFKIRELVINSIPMSLRLGISAGIGLFLAIIALTTKGVEIIVANPATVVSIGHITSLHCILAILGFLLTIALVYHNVKGGAMISILVITVIGVVLGDVKWGGLVSAPPSISPTFLQLDLKGVLTVGLIPVIFAFLFVDLFDTAGTLVGVASKANLIGKDGKLPRLNRALLADSSATVIGSLFGTSNTTSFVESTAGVAAGGRTGLTAVVVGVLFLFALFFSPLAGMIPSYATTGVLLYVAVLMLSGLKEIDWSDLTEAAPAAVTCIMMPFTYSIAQGIALGFISYALIKLLTGKAKEVSVPVWVLAVIFALAYAYHVIG